MLDQGLLLRTTATWYGASAMLAAWCPPTTAPAGEQNAAPATSAAAGASTHRRPIDVDFGILRVRLKRRFIIEQGSARE
jgi:hypothetical protein